MGKCNSKMNSQKGSLNLAVSYVVTIIIVLLMLFLAFRFFTSGLSDANKGVIYVDSVQREQVLKRLSLENMNSFALFNKEKVLAGDSAEFVLGVKNNFVYQKTFNVQILFAEGRDVNGKKIDNSQIPTDLYLWHRQSPIELIIDSRDSDVFGLSIAPPQGTPPGEYIFEVIISSCDSSCTYYDRQILRLVVE